MQERCHAQGTLRCMQLLPLGISEQSCTPVRWACARDLRHVQLPPPSRSGFPRGEEVTMRCQELEVPYGNHTAAAAALDAHARAAVAGDQAERVVRTQ